MIDITIFLEENRIPLMFQITHLLEALTVFIVITYTPVTLEKVKKE
jgi:hypothetical protein